jgi:hypothetical protein
MNMHHLSDEALDRVLAGGKTSEDERRHLGECLLCRRRRDGFLHVVGEAGGSDPDAERLGRIRNAALDAWGAPHGRGWVRWLRAAAAVALLALLPLLGGRPASRPRLNADAVLMEVDRVLDRDPLTAVADEDVLETMVPGTENTTGRNAS